MGLQMNPELRHRQPPGVAVRPSADWLIVETSSPSTTLGANGTSSSAAVTVVEPDYRFTLANERTFLAWQRTALGLLAAAVGVVQFMPELAVPGLRHVLGGAIGVLAMLTAGAGLHRWIQVDHAIRREQPLPRPATPIYLAVGLVAIGLVTVVLALAATAGGR
jgi:putative membrane protein